MHEKSLLIIYQYILNIVLFEISNYLSLKIVIFQTVHETAKSTEILNNLRKSIYT